ncbi:MAG: bifunctional oligoribonuclease/PAP phosphatase NrnA [Bacteroidales bacterium]|nr:bifunctional oligoribonuclease/PAP phosphatase NrnA [Bacteroidales bacterium]
MTNSDFSSIGNLLRGQGNIIITSHYNPDGDAVGSAMAMYHTIKQINPNVTVVLPNRFPDFLKWIKNAADVVIFDQYDQQNMAGLFNKASVIFCLDYNAPSRVESMADTMMAAPATKILIDHHPNPDTAAFNYLLSKISASSTAELVYEFLEESGLTSYINKAAAECIYTGIITDTGSFSFSCNNPKTYRIMAALIEIGVDAEKLHRLIYDNFSESRLRLLGYAFDKKLLILSEYRTAIISLSKQELNDFQYKTGDTEGIVNYPLSIKEINVSILMTERDDLIRLSFRSKGDFAVNRIAAEYFEGGGHKNAAGGNSYLSINDTIEKIKSILPFYQNELNGDFK